MLLRTLGLVCLLTVSAAPVIAQVLPAAPAASLPPAAVQPPALTRADTARSVHDLFRSRRGRGTGWLALGTAGLLASTLPALQTTSAGIWVPGVVAGSAFAALGLNKRIRFSRGREREVLRELAATGHLPAHISRRLHGNFLPLHSTSSADNPLLDQDIAPPAAAAAAYVSGLAMAPAQALAEARQDTLDAVQGLFNAKRFVGQLPILLALPGLRLLTGSNASSSSSPYGPPQQSSGSEASAGQVAAGLLLMAGGVTYMFVHNAPYSDAKFAALRTSYLAGNPLPPAIRASLKPKHIAPGRVYRERLERKAARKKR